MPEERRETYVKIQEIMREDLPFLPLFQYANVRGYKTGLEGFEPNVNVRIESWNVNTWKWT